MPPRVSRSILTRFSCFSGLSFSLTLTPIFLVFFFQSPYCFSELSLQSLLGINLHNATLLRFYCRLASAVDASSRVHLWFCDRGSCIPALSLSDKVFRLQFVFIFDGIWIAQVTCLNPFMSTMTALDSCRKGTRKLHGSGPPLSLQM